MLFLLLTAYTQAGENIVNIDANFTEISSPNDIITGQALNIH